MRDSMLREGFPPLTTLDDAARVPSGPLAVEHGVAVTDVAPQWDALADAVGAPPFLYPRWFTAWERAFAPRGVELVTVRRGGYLVAVLPLLGRARGLRGAANDHTPAFGAVTADRAAADALARALVERRRCIDFAYADPNAPEMAALVQHAAAAGYRTAERGRLRQPYVNLDGSWTEYEAALDRKVRKEGARLRRRLAEHGDVAFEYDDGGDRLHERLSEGFAIEGSGWKSERGTAIASCRATEAFYRAVAEWALERGWLRLAFLRVDGRAAAFDLCLEQRGVIYALKGGFDPDMRRFGPGTLLVRETLMHAFARGLSRYEFLGADDPYKLAWTDRGHDRVRLVTHPPTLRESAARLGERAAARVRSLAGR